MARDLGLEQILREDLSDVPGLTEKAMFGGWAWLPDGRLILGAREDGVLIRLGKDHEQWALDAPDIAPMISRGRRIQGWVRAGPQVFGNDKLRLKLIEEAIRFVKTIP